MTKGYSRTVIIAGVALMSLILVGRILASHLESVTNNVAAMGLRGALVFILIYALATTAFVPAGLLTLTSGALFGLVRGSVYAFVGATLSACLSFLMSRYLMRDAVEVRVIGRARMRAVMSAVEKDGLRVVALLRMSPVIPFALINWSMGITRIRFAHFVMASAGMIPVTLLYTYYGTVAGSVLAAQQGHVHHDAAYYALLGAGLIATIVVTTIVSRLAKRALEAETDA